MAPEDEMQEAKADEAEPKATDMPKVKSKSRMEARVLRDFWDHAEVRHPAGSIVLVTTDEMIDGAERGHLARVRKDN